MVMGVDDYEDLKGKVPGRVNKAWPLVDWYYNDKRRGEMNIIILEDKKVFDGCEFCCW